MIQYVWYLSWNIYHMFVYPCKLIKLSLWIFTRLKRIFLNLFSDPVCGWQARSVDRNGRPNQGPVDRCGRPTCTALCTSGRHRVGRPDQRALLSVSGRSTGRSTVTESPALCIWAVDRDAPTVIFMTVGGRPAGWPPACQADRSA